MDGRPDDGAGPTEPRPAPRALRALAAFGGVLLFAMMLLTFADVAGRTMGRPVPGAKEATELMLAAVVFLLLPVIAWERGHIVIDLLDGVVPRALRWPQRLAVEAAGLVTGAVAAMALARQARLAFAYGDRIAYLDLPTGIVVWAMAGLMSLAALAFAAGIVRDVMLLARGGGRRDA